MKIEKNITISDFIKVLEKMRDEIERRDEPGKIGGNHNLQSRIDFVYDVDDEDESTVWLEIDELQMDYMMGCMCPRGITFRFKKEK